MLLNYGVREDSWESLGLQGDQFWIYTGRTDAETPIIWPPDAKSWLICKDPDAGKDCGKEEKGTTEHEMVGWHHWLDSTCVWVKSGSWWWTAPEAWRAAVHGVAESRRQLNWTDTDTGGLVCIRVSTVSAKASITWRVEGKKESEVAQSCPTLCDPEDWYQALPSMEFSRQEYWSGLPYPSPGDLPNPEIKPGSLHCRQTLYHLSYQGSLQCILVGHIGRKISPSHGDLKGKKKGGGEWPPYIPGRASA